MSTDRRALIQNLLEGIESLSDVAIRTLTQMVGALGRDVLTQRNLQSSLVSETLAEEFALRLVLFHAAHEVNLTKKTFEFVFANALRSSGHIVELTDNAVFAGADMTVDGVPYSLKTEGGKSVRRDVAHISKFMELRAMRGCRTAADFVALTKEHFVPHTNRYQKILSLRSWRGGQEIEYQLLEIPISILKRANLLEEEDFGEPTQGGSCSAIVRSQEGDPLFTLVYDGSVEKITLRGIIVEACTDHCRWTVEV